MCTCDALLVQENGKTKFFFRFFLHLPISRQYYQEHCSDTRYLHRSFTSCLPGVDWWSFIAPAPWQRRGANGKNAGCLTAPAPHSTEQSSTVRPSGVGYSGLVWPRSRCTVCPVAPSREESLLVAAAHRRPTGRFCCAGVTDLTPALTQTRGATTEYYATDDT